MYLQLLSEHPLLAELLHPVSGYLLKEAQVSYAHEMQVAEVFHLKAFHPYLPGYNNLSWLPLLLPAFRQNLSLLSGNHFLLQYVRQYATHRTFHFWKNTNKWWRIRYLISMAESPCLRYESYVRFHELSGIPLHRKEFYLSCRYSLHFQYIPHLV